MGEGAGDEAECFCAEAASRSLTGDACVTFAAGGRSRGFAFEVFTGVLGCEAATSSADEGQDLSVVPILDVSA